MMELWEKMGRARIRYELDNLRLVPSIEEEGGHLPSANVKRIALDVTFEFLALEMIHDSLRANGEGGINITWRLPFNKGQDVQVLIEQDIDEETGEEIHGEFTLMIYLWTHRNHDDHKGTFYSWCVPDINDQNLFFTQLAREAREIFNGH
jgi:hypothetical protein